MLFRILLGLALTVSSATVSIPCRGDSLELLDRAVRTARTHVMASRTDNQYWNFPSYLGTHYISQYVLLSKWLSIPKSQLDPERLKDLVLRTQLADGSWYAVLDTNVHSGDLNATILNYWALKAMGLDPTSTPLAHARQFILKHGGLEKSSLFIKIVSALFGNYPWNSIPKIPYALFVESSPLNYHQFAQWVGPHLMPIAYLRELRVFKTLGPDYKIDELWANRDSLQKFRGKPLSRDQPSLLSTHTLLIKKILEKQRPGGSWGGYTSATLFTRVALADYVQITRHLVPEITTAIDKAHNFIEGMFFESGDQAYLGVVDDGRIWDSALIGIAALDSGEPLDQLKITADFLVSKQTPEGGFPFGFDFEYAPDTDDTAEILLFLSRFGNEYQDPVSRAKDWLFRMQNNDGGWGAFDRNNTGNFLLATLAKDFQDSADLFDESSPDVTGHILEALGTLGDSIHHSASVVQAVAYLRNSQNPVMGTWTGRWGVNYLYGTSAAVVGLIKVGISPEDPMLVHALQWLMSKQNPDGGFGETTLSDIDASLAGIGVSTASQTAWVLIALIESGNIKSAAATRAADYLVRECSPLGVWKDQSAVGTGHPKIVYMNYPSYPHAFPLTALARYQYRMRTK
ncbi:prenyltransferase/squalene oxidase repeat-containing protein [Bdellovibrionota bacterium FG-1]